MLITIVVCLLSVLFAFLESYNSNSKGYLPVSFLIVFIFLALRYDFGNDYMSYYDFFSDVRNKSMHELLNFREYQRLGLHEFGFTWLNKIIPNFYLLVALLALFSCFVYYSFIKNYGTKNLLWLSVFIFLFDPIFMLVQSSAMRQTVAICLFIYSMRYLIERNFWKYILLIFIGSLFHKSALILIPIYFVITPTIWNRRIVTAMIVGYLFITFFGYTLLVGIERITSHFFITYKESYMTDILSNPLNSGLGYLFWSSIFLLILWSHDKGESHNTVISKLSIIGFVLSPMGIYFTMFERIGMYFGPAMILSIPFAVSLQESKLLKRIIVTILVLWYSYGFAMFFQNPVWVEKFSTYKVNLFHGL